MLAASWALAVAVSLGAGVASANTLVYEPFDYAPGTRLHDVTATGQNLAGPYQGYGASEPYQLTVVGADPTPPVLQGLPGTAGGRLVDTIGATPGGARVDLDVDVEIAPGSTIYWSALLTLDDSSNANHLASASFIDDLTGDSISFGEPVVGRRNVRVATSTVASNGQQAGGTDDAFADGDTLFLVGRYHNGSAPGGDSLSLIGYDTSYDTTLPDFFDPFGIDRDFSIVLADFDIDMERITSLEFTIRGSGDNFIDELRIGSTYESVVVPEPGTGLLLGVALLGLAIRRRTPPGRPGRSHGG